MNRKLVPAIVFIAVLALALGFQMHWLVRDEAPMGNDATYLYLTRTLEFLYEMESAVTGCDLMAALGRLSVHGRPALYQVMAIPFVVAGQGAEDAARGINLVFLALGALAVLGWGSTLGRARAGLLGAVLFITFPTIVGVVHDFHPHAIIPSLCALTFWLLSALLRHPTLARAWALGAMLGLGALVHPSYLALTALPAAAVVARLLWRRHGGGLRAGGARSLARALATDRLVRFGLIPGLGLAALALLAWYLGPGLEILRTWASWKGDEVETFRSRRLVVDGFYQHRGPWWYLLTMPAALSAPLALAGVLAVAHRARRLAAGQWLPIAAMVSVVMVTYWGETAFAWWKMASALPVLALVIALAVDDIPARRLRRGVVAALVVVAALNFAYVLFGGRWGHAYARVVGARPYSSTCATRARHARVMCAEPPHTASVADTGVVRAIRNAGKDLKPAHRMLLVVDDLRLQPARVAYWLARDWPGNGFRVRGVGTKTWGLPYNLRYLLRSRLIFYVDHGRKRVTGDSYVRATQRLLTDQPQAFARAHGQVASFPVMRGTTVLRPKRARLMRRTQPLSVAEVEHVVKALGLPAAQLRQHAEILAEMRQQAAARAQQLEDAAGR